SDVFQSRRNDAAARAQEGTHLVDGLDEITSHLSQRRQKKVPNRVSQVVRTFVRNTMLKKLRYRSVASREGDQTIADIARRWGSEFFAEMPRAAAIVCHGHHCSECIEVDRRMGDVQKTAEDRRKTGASTERHDSLSVRAPVSAERTPQSVIIDRPWVCK